MNKEKLREEIKNNLNKIDRLDVLEYINIIISDIISDLQSEKITVTE